MDSEALVVFSVFYLFFMLISSAVSIAAYVFQSIGLQTMGKKAGIENSWLAWVPVGNLYIIGSLAEKSNAYYGKKNGKLQLILPILFGGTIILLPILVVIIAVLGSLVGMTGDIGGAFLLIFLFYLLMIACAVAVSVFTYIALYKIYKLYAPDQVVLYLLLSIFISLASSIIIFILRNREIPTRQANFSAPGGGWGAPPAGGTYVPHQGGFTPPPAPGYGVPPQQGGVAPQQPPVYPNGGNYPPPPPPQAPSPF